jgi:hypothetical protein
VLTEAVPSSGIDMGISTGIETGSSVDVTFGILIETETGTQSLSKTKLPEIDITVSGQPTRT